MNIKEKIEELTAKIKESPQLLSKFQEKPVATLEGLLGVNLPDDQIEKIVDGVKAKIKLDNVSDKLGGLFGKK